MTYVIRLFRNEDYENIARWWTDQNECPPLPGMMIEDGTFVLELGNVPVLSLTVFLTQSKEIAYVEGFIKNPQVKEFSLETYGTLLWEHCFKYAQNKGYKRVICYCLVDKLVEKYKRFGMQVAAKGLCGMIKEL